MKEPEIKNQISTQASSLFTCEDTGQSDSYKKRSKKTYHSSKRRTFKPYSASEKHLSKTYKCKKTIRKAAIKILARREYSKQELVMKLQRYYEVIAIHDVLSELKQQDWQSDVRFAEMWVRARSKKGFGPARIYQELIEKGVEEFVIQSALEQDDVDWFELAQAVFEKKYSAFESEGRFHFSSWAEKAKCLNFMQYRGFSQTYFQHLL